MKEKETGKMKNQNNTAQSAGKKSFLQKKNVEISLRDMRLMRWERWLLDYLRLS